MSSLHPLGRDSFDIKEAAYQSRAGDRGRSQDPLGDCIQEVKNHLIENHSRVFTNSILDPKVRHQVEYIINDYLDRQAPNVPGYSLVQLQEAVVREIVGLGPLEQYVMDSSISEIMVNGPQEIRIERDGKQEYLKEVNFRDDEHLLYVIRKILDAAKKVITPAEPLCDAKIGDNRVNVAIPPVSLVGPVLTIRKYLPRNLTEEEMIQKGIMTEPMIEFLKLSVRAYANIIIAGATGSGKTTLMRRLFEYIPDEERNITIEDTEELRIKLWYPGKHTIAMEARASDEERTNISLDKLLKNALRQYPRRIHVGEVRSLEVLTLLKSWNTGHQGGMSTVHSNSPQDTVERLLMMALESGIRMEANDIARLICNVLDIVIYQQKMIDGRRRITEISEVGYENGQPVVRDIFKYVVTGRKGDELVGHFEQVGNLSPELANKFIREGADPELAKQFL